MNDTEPFDDRVREALDNLDTSPAHFRQAAVWQKLQAELHPAAEKKSFFIRRRFFMPTFHRTEASKLRIAAAATLLLLAGGAWWKIQSTPIPRAIHPAENKPKNSPVLPQKQPLLAAKDEVLYEEVTFKKQVLLKRQSNAKRTEISLAQAPMAAPSESVNNVGRDRPAPADRCGVPNPADVPEAPKNTAEIYELPEVVTVPVSPTNPSIAKTIAKPKFKIVHANELADYQKAELAEARQKEAKAKGFIVINWNANNSNQPQSNLVTYLKNKSSKAD